MGPPAAFGFRAAGDEIVESGDGWVTDPVLVFHGRRRVDDAGDVPAAGEHEAGFAAEGLGEFEGRFCRRDMIFLAGLDEGGGFHGFQIDGHAAHGERAGLDHQVFAIQILDILLVPSGRHVGGI